MFNYQKSRWNNKREAAVLLVRLLKILTVNEPSASIKPIMNQGLIRFLDLLLIRLELATVVTFFYFLYVAFNNSKCCFYN